MDRFVTSSHPCFDDRARASYSRLHLPVAAVCNVQCNYCDRRFDCIGESRPGVTSALLSPEAAADYVDEAQAMDPSLRVVGIAGPGDPLADAERTLTTLRLVHERHPELLLCVATNGLSLPLYVNDLVALNTSHVTVTVNAIDPTIGGRLYAWVRDGSHRLSGAAAGERIWQAQSQGIRTLVQRGVLVKVNAVLVPGVNADHLVDVAREVGALGACRFNCIPMHPVPTARFGGLEAPSRGLLELVRGECARHVALMTHCSRCRADAWGRIGRGASESHLALLRKHARSSAPERPYVAVLSHEGVFVNQSLGEATQLWIFGRERGGFVLVERRAMPGSERKTERWLRVAARLRDCRVLLVQGAGATPRGILASAGVEVLATSGPIEEALVPVYDGLRPPEPRDSGFVCGKGSSCSGVGVLCG